MEEKNLGYEEGYNQALIDVKLRAIDTLRKIYLDKKNYSNSRKNKSYYDSKLYALKDIEEYIRILSSKEPWIIHIQGEQRQGMSTLAMRLK